MLDNPGHLPSASISVIQYISFLRFILLTWYLSWRIPAQVSLLDLFASLEAAFLALLISWGSVTHLGFSSSGLFSTGGLRFLFPREPLTIVTDGTEILVTESNF